MPRRSSGPRLWFDKARGTFTIVDGRSRHRTGFTLDETRQAEKFLGEYIASKHVVKDGASPFIADVLAAYTEEHLVDKVSVDHITYDIKKLGKWWGDKRVSDINATTCREYTAHRKAPTSARRELAFLTASINYWHKEHGPLKVVPVVTKPPKPSSRTEWMTRSEAARFLWAARRTPHLVRFFIVGWYTGTRRAKICGLKWLMIDFKSSVMQRKERGAVETRKKAPPVRIGARLMSYLKRWKRLDGKDVEYVVNFRGKKIRRPVSSWERVRDKAELPEHVTPHILRHTRATTLMRAGVDPWEAANSLGMSLKVLIDTYGHHHPDWQKDAADAR